jgi:hypothetical protein
LLTLTTTGTDPEGTVFPRIPFGFAVAVNGVILIVARTQRLNGNRRNPPVSLVRPSAIAPIKTAFLPTSSALCPRVSSLDAGRIGGKP